MRTDAEAQRVPLQVGVLVCQRERRRVRAGVAGLGDDEQLDSAFSLHAVVLPTPGATTWTVILELDESDHLVHFDFERWTLLDVAWSD